MTRTITSITRMRHEMQHREITRGRARECARIDPTICPRYLYSLAPHLADDFPSGARMGKPTYRPRNKRRIRTHGYRTRMATRWGREVLSRRRKKGRKRLAVQLPTKYAGA
jgi:large subunit ribosomal protein L34